MSTISDLSRELGIRPDALIQSLHSMGIRKFSFQERLTATEVAALKSKTAVEAAALKKHLEDAAVALKQRIIEKHGEFLRQKGINPDGISAHKLSDIYNRSHRSTVCYACNSGLDNEIDLDCPRCKWIICTQCGACGCGHPQYGPEISRRVAQHGNDAPTSQKNSGAKSFADYASASEHARQHPGSTLRRQPTTEGWLVTYKASVNNDT